MRIFKKNIFAFLGLAFAFLLTVFIILVCFENNIYIFILDRINKNISTEISSKKTKLSLFKYFPNAALTFYDVNVNFNKSFSLFKADTINANKCISAKEITIKINLFQLIKNPIIINGINVKNGSITAIENQHGNKNYQFENNLSKNSNALIFQFQKISLQNVNLKYLSEKSDLYINTYIKILIIHGKLQKNAYNFKTLASLNHIIISSTKTHLSWNYISDISFNFNSKVGLISLTDGEFHSLNEKIKFKGNIYPREPNKYDFLVQSQSLKITNLRKLNIPIPEAFSISKGNCSVYIYIYRKNEINSSANIYAFSLFKGLSFNYKEIRLNNINCRLLIKGKFITTFKGSISAEDINGNLFNSQFNVPILKYENITDSLLGNGSLIVKQNDFKNFIKDSIIDFRSGEIKWSFLLKSRINKNANYLLSRLFDNSSISIKDLNCSFLKNKCQVTNLNGKINTSAKTLEITHSYAIINHIPFSFNGNILNYQSIFRDSSNNLKINGELIGKYLNLNNFIISNKTGNNDNSFKFKSVTFNANLIISFDTIVFKKIRLNNYHSSLLYSNYCFSLNKINSIFCEGKVINGTINMKIDPNLVILTSSCNFEKINIEKLFTSFDDFGQNEITSKNIKGQLNGNANCKILWKNCTFSKDNLQGFIDFEVNNGELNGFRPIYKLSKFIKISELNNIKFKNIANKISINNKSITIPLMSINSSALNLSLSGNHSFNNVYEYHFKVILSDLLYKKQVSKNILTFKPGSMTITTG